MKLRCIVFTWLLLVVVFNSSATHMRGGQIHARQKAPGSLVCTITVEIYIDTESGVPMGGSTDFLYYGDGTARAAVPEIVQGTTIPGASWTLIDSQKKIALVRYTIDRTYLAYGTYKIMYTEVNRNQGIVNFDQSVDTPFYVETDFTVSPVNQNSTPKNLTSSMFFGWTGIPFSFSVAAHDSNDYALYYQLEVPKKDSQSEVINYKFPENFVLNPFNGQVTWDGKFNGAYVTGEYTFNVIIYQVDGDIIVGKTTRDFQVMLSDGTSASSVSDNADLNADNRIHAPVGTPVVLKVFAEADNSSDISLKAFSALTDFPANFSFVTADSVHATRKIKVGILTISPTEDIVRENPYAIAIRAGFDDGEITKETDVTYLFYSKDIEITEVPDIIGEGDDEVTSAEGNQPYLQAYPNPVFDYLSLEGIAGPGMRVVMVSLTGEIVSDQLVQKDKTLDLRQLDTGFYFLKITGANNQSKTIRIVKR